MSVRVAEAVVDVIETATEPSDGAARRSSTETEADKIRRQQHLRRKARLARRALIAHRTR